MLATRTLEIESAAVFEPLYQPARYKGAYGGRGSGKSHDRAGALIDDSLYERGLLSVCIREVQKSLKDSAKRLIESKLSEYRLGEADGFKVYADRIQTPGNGVIIFQGMQDHTAESIKSLEGFARAWVEEAQTMSARSLQLLRPTIRAPGSELWFTWNPRRKIDPVDAMFRTGNSPTGAQLVRANWNDNPWFPKELEQERVDCMRDDPDQYGHIWEGDYVTVALGAYYARHLAKAREEGRIGIVAEDPNMVVRLFVDIGGTGARADNFVIWAAQHVGTEIRWTNHYEVQGQPVSAHLAWLRGQGYTPDRAKIWLPHDGATNDRLIDASFESAFRAAGYEVIVIKNQGAGAAKARIEEGRRLFPRMRFDEAKCDAGLQALGWYHEKKDEARNIGLGPDHDWASHCFTGDTLVQTNQGLIRFDKLPPTGLVLTPCGLRLYRSPRLMRVNAPLAEVRFSDGHTVRCTPDHLFATGDGWKSAQSLAPGSLILSTSTRSRSILTAACIGAGLTKNTLAGAASGFIATCGRMLSAQFRLAATSIIATETRLTTGSITLSAWMAESISALHGTKAPSRIKPSIFQPWRGIVPPTGTSPKRDGFGISATLPSRSSGQRTSALSALVNSAAKCFSDWIGRRQRGRNTARQLANAKPIGSREKHALTPLRIKSVRLLNERADVWDITVPDVECFALANGAVVHNSADAFGLGAIAYTEPTAPEVPIVRHGGWMAT